MGQRALINAIYNAQVGLTGARYRQEPTGAAGVAVADDALWDQIIAGTVLDATDPHWLAGITITTPLAGGADTEEVIAEGIGGVDGAAIAAATLLAEFDIGYVVVTAAGEVHEPPIFLPVVLRCGDSIVVNGTRHAGRLSSSPVGGNAITLGITYISGLDT